MTKKTTKNKKINVYYRIFPAEKMDWEYVKFEKSEEKIYIRNLQELSKKRQLHDSTTFWEFQTDGIFYNVPQDIVYDSVTKDLVKNVCEGYTGIIVSFGQTGMGKSFTTSGLYLRQEEFGIAPRLVMDLIKMRESQAKNIKMIVELSYLEFSRSNARDLLSDQDYCDPHKKPLKKKIKTVYDGLEILYKSEGRKSMIKSNMDYYSHIGSTVLTFSITTKNMDYSDPKKISSRLHVIDLAGTDTVGNLTSIFKSAQQIGSANLTKSNLGQFILCLNQNVVEYIKVWHRLNPLLYYLGNDLSRDNILTFIGHVNTAKNNLPVTISMFRFGHFLRGLKPMRKKISFEMDEEVRLQYLEARLFQMEREKCLNSMIQNRDLTVNLTPDRIEHLKSLVADFLKDTIKEIDIIGLADYGEIFKIFKDICKEYEAERNKFNQEKHSLSESSLRYKKSKGSQNSLSPGTKGSSRRSSKRSESVNIPAKAPSKLSQASVSSVTSAKKMKKGPVLSTSSQRLKRKSRSNSLTLKHSNVALDKAVSKTSIMLPIPDIIPEKQEAWNMFVNDPKSTFKKLQAEYKRTETDIQNVYKEYLAEIKNMYNEKEHVNKKNLELINAQTFRKFDRKDEFDDEGILVLSYAEKICKENLQKAEAHYLNQQEKVLKVQADLKLYLEHRMEIRKNLCEDFDQYCMEKFEIVIGGLESVEKELEKYTINIELENNEEEVEVMNIPECDMKQQMKKLKEIMQLEFEKTQKILQMKQKAWKD